MLNPSGEKLLSMISSLSSVCRVKYWAWIALTGPTRDYGRIPKLVHFLCSWPLPSSCLFNVSSSLIPVRARRETISDPSEGDMDVCILVVVAQREEKTERNNERTEIELYRRPAAADSWHERGREGKEKRKQINMHSMSTCSRQQEKIEMLRRRSSQSDCRCLFFFSRP